MLAMFLSNIRWSLHWRHNGRDCVSSHQPYDCLLNRLFRSTKTSKLHVTGLCERNSPGTGEFPAQMASNAESVYIWWRHDVYSNWNVVLFVRPLYEYSRYHDISRVKRNWNTGLGFEFHLGGVIEAVNISPINRIFVIKINHANKRETIKALHWRFVLIINR